MISEPRQTVLRECAWRKAVRGVVSARRLGVHVALLGLLASANRVEACPLQIDGAPDAAWLDAARQLESAAATGDCESLTLNIAGPAAELSLVTRDGRSAKRALQSPAELIPTFEALVTVEAVRAPAEGRPGKRSERTPASAASTWSWLATGLLGVRGGQGGLVSPVAELAFAHAATTWTFGGFVTSEPVTLDITRSFEFVGASVGAGLAGGPQFQRGEVALRPSLRVAVIGSSSSKPNPAPSLWQSVRLGLAFSAAFPNTSRVRFYGEARVEVEPAWLGTSTAQTASAQSVLIRPPWALGAVFGAELGLF